jgi:hypothetical protein
LQSSNSDTKVSFAAGAKFVFVTYPADKAVLTDNAQTLTNKTISGASNSISNIGLASQVTGTLPLANGGTNATTASAALANLGGVSTGKSIAMAIVFGG